MKALRDKSQHNRSEKIQKSDNLDSKITFSAVFLLRILKLEKSVHD